MRPVRLLDVAIACGVDRSTASRALRNNPLVNAATAALIKARALKLGYEPHPTARALRTGRTGNVLLIAGDFKSTLEQEAARELAIQFTGHGTDLYLATHQGDDGIYRRLLDKASCGGFDGVVIIPARRGLADRHEEDLYSKGLPMVFLDRYPPKSRIPVVTTANASAAAALTGRVANSGAKRLVCCMADYNEVSHARRKACMTFARKHFIPCTYASNPDEVKLPPGNTPVGVVGISQADVWAAMENVRAVEPETQLYGAVFDSWIGSSAPAREVFIAIQDFTTMARLATSVITDNARDTKITEVPLLDIRTLQ